MSETEARQIMARPRRCRRICEEPAYDRFIPDGVMPASDAVVLTLDEYETIRLVDLEKCTHQQCAKQMDISRTTVTELYESAREKIADSVVNGKALQILGGHYRLCDGTASDCFDKTCRKSNVVIKNTMVKTKGANTMRIAVTFDNGEIFQHFGHTEQFKLYDVEDGKVIGTQIIDTNSQGHGALAGFLMNANVDAVICGGIGGGAQTALAAASIQLYGGVTGLADDAVNDYIAGTLNHNPNVRCSHHEHEHSCGEHHCGEEKHGCSGN